MNKVILILTLQCGDQIFTDNSIPVHRDIALAMIKDTKKSGIYKNHSFIELN